VVLLVILKYLDKETKRRREIAELYLKGIKNNKLILPKVISERSHVWHLFVMRTEDRDQFIKYMKRKGIGTLIHYPIPPHKQSAYREWNKESYPITEEIHKTVISLPLNPAMTSSEVKQVIEACNRF
jgi:dTDP-4-amino-4,6-dideoxygalactose transaminase